MAETQEQRGKGGAVGIRGVTLKSRLKEQEQELAELERQRGRALAERLSMGVLTRAWQMLLKGLGEVRAAPAALAAVANAQPTAISDSVEVSASGWLTAPGPPGYPVKPSNLRRHRARTCPRMSTASHAVAPASANATSPCVRAPGGTTGTYERISRRTNAVRAGSRRGPAASYEIGSSGISTVNVQSPEL